MEKNSKLIAIAARLLTTMQFTHIDDIDLPKNFGKHRKGRLRWIIDNHNEDLKRIAIEIKKIANPHQ